MKIISNHWLGLIAFCPQCNLILQYTIDDVDNEIIRCPKCHEAIHVMLKEGTNYVVQQKEKANNNPAKTTTI